MVIKVSTESIKGIRAGRPGYTKKVEVKSIPMFRGKAEPKFDDFYMVANPGTEYAGAVRAKEGKKMVLNHIKVNATKNVLISISVRRRWEERVGYRYIEELGEKRWVYRTYSTKKIERTGYGEVELHDLGLSVKGIFKKREIPTGDVINVASARIESSISIRSDKPVQIYGRVWGNIKPLK